MIGNVLSAEKIHVYVQKDDWRLCKEISASSSLIIKLLFENVLYFFLFCKNVYIEKEPNNPRPKLGGVEV